MTNRRGLAADTPQAILDAAEELFASQGYHGAGTRAIAQRAGANLALISYYFGSKEKLFEAVVERGLAEIEKTVTAATPVGGDTDDLFEITRRLVAALLSHRLFLRVLFADLLVGPRGCSLAAFNKLARVLRATLEEIGENTVPPGSLYAQAGLSNIIGATFSTMACGGLPGFEGTGEGVSSFLGLATLPTRLASDAGAPRTKRTTTVLAPSEPGSDMGGEGSQGISDAFEPPIAPQRRPSEDWLD
ncbi:MAG: TetR/AcrR family transcriptional regulator [Candidatus Hydrogenedentes bacterium]|nr:TetR/AcrR family transcriptional regulator [Candidatus Hydrogenedentota bacterium]